MVKMIINSYISWGLTMGLPLIYKHSTDSNLLISHNLLKQVYHTEEKAEVQRGFHRHNSF